MVTTASESVRPPQYVGASVLRVEDRKFLMGKGEYLDDITPPGVLQAAFLRSPHPHARIRGIDVSGARTVGGVVGVFTGHDLLESVAPMVTGLPIPDEEVRTCFRRALPVDKVRHVGEAVAVVVARSRYIAEDACDLIEVEWEPLPAVVDAERSLVPDAPLIDEDLPDNNVVHLEVAGGDGGTAFAEADHVFSKRFHNGRSHAAPLETRGIIADYDPASRVMTLWMSNQMPHLTRTMLAEPLGIPENKLRIIAPEVGGGFGLKAHVFAEDLIIPALSRLLQQPVKWIEDRYENLAASAHAREVRVDLEIAVKSDGTFLGFRERILGDPGAYSCDPYTPLIDVLMAGMCLPGVYNVPNVEFVADAPLTNKCQTGAYRATGMVVVQTVREMLIEEIARELGTDPVELRVKNCIPPEPYKTALGQQYDGGSYAESLRMAQEMLGYEALRARQANLRKEGRYLGIGFSANIEPSGWSTPIARAHGWKSETFAFFDAASVTMEPDGSIIVTTGLHSHGQSLETTLAQVAADRLGARLEDVTVVQGDTASAVYGMGTYASRGAVVGAGSISRAAGEVRTKLARLASEALEASPDDMELEDGRAFVRGAPDRGMTFGEIANFAYFGYTRRPADLEEPAPTSTRSYEPKECYSNATMAAVVEVDAETGEVDVQRFVAVEDCGTMLNPMVVEGQVTGGVAQGIGAALYEELVYNEDGQFLSGNLVDFLYPSFVEIPSIEVAHIETPSPATEGGVKGMGEGGLMAAPAAILNAVADAVSPLGVKIHRSPVTPSSLLAQILEAQDAPDRI